VPETQNRAALAHRLLAASVTGQYSLIGYKTLEQADNMQITIGMSQLPEDAFIMDIHFGRG
jgi:hypothetical protein